MSLKIRRRNNRQLWHDEILSLINLVSSRRGSIAEVAEANNVSVHELIEYQHRYHSGGYDRLRGRPSKREVELAVKIKKLELKIEALEETILKLKIKSVEIHNDL